MKLTTLFPHYKVVNDLTIEGLEPDRTYQTTDPDLFTSVQGNRGKTKGIVDKKVKEISDLMKTPHYCFEIPTVLVNLKGKIIEGTHTKYAFVDNDHAIPFRILFGDKYNQDEKILPMIQSSINGVPTSWTSLQQFGGAVDMGMPLALRIVELRAIKVKSIHNVMDGDLRPSLFLTILGRDKNNTHNKKKQMYEYADDNLYNRSFTKEFLNDFDFVCNIIDSFKHINIDTNRVIEQALFLIWDNPKFNRNNLLYNLATVGFGLDGSRYSGKKIRNRLLDLSMFTKKELTALRATR